MSRAQLPVGQAGVARYLAITNINHMDALGLFRHEERPWSE
ncbi:MAG: hypothetical protein ACE5H9_21905 [Anaerolineae bacterium]